MNVQIISRLHSNLKYRISLSIYTYTYLKNLSKYRWLQIDQVFFPLPKVGDIRYPLGSHSFKSLKEQMNIPK